MAVTVQGRARGESRATNCTTFTPMNHAPRLHPCLPVPHAEQRRLAAVAHLALIELRAGQAVQALADLRAMTIVVSELLRHYHAEDGARTCQEAAAALASVDAGTTTAAAAAAVCAPLVEVFVDLLCVCTLRRLEDAKAAVRQKAATCP